MVALASASVALGLFAKNWVDVLFSSIIVQHHFSFLLLQCYTHCLTHAIVCVTQWLQLCLGNEKTWRWTISEESSAFAYSFANSPKATLALPRATIPSSHCVSFFRAVFGVADHSATELSA